MLSRFAISSLTYDRIGISISCDNKTTAQNITTSRKCFTSDVYICLYHKSNRHTLSSI